jgi:hypothetical protein
MRCQSWRAHWLQCLASSSESATQLTAYGCSSCLRRAVVCKAPCSGRVLVLMKRAGMQARRGRVGVEGAPPTDRAPSSPISAEARGIAAPQSTQRTLSSVPAGVEAVRKVASRECVVEIKRALERRRHLVVAAQHGVGNTSKGRTKRGAVERRWSAAAQQVAAKDGRILIHKTWSLSAGGWRGDLRVLQRASLPKLNNFEPDFQPGQLTL